MSVVMPVRTTTCDDKAGNHFIIIEINHTNGEDSVVMIPDAAVSIGDLPADAGVGLLRTAGDNNAAVNPASGRFALENTQTGASGLGFTFAANDGVKQLVVDTDVATGTYFFVVRCVGSASGTASTSATL
jgi:hypothetical protein